MDTSSPRLVGDRYVLLSRLGAGGMGTVWRARDEVLGREVAVKEVTFPQGVSDEDRDVLSERTRREARAAARLDHPSAVTVYDVVEHDGAPYLVMELVEARTLADVVRTDGPLSPQRTAQVGLALLGALEAAHAQGIVHRDVKPSNVMVRDDDRVVLTDFGIATSTGDPSITSTGLLLGSPAYISPERAQGTVPGPPADLWSLGATLFTAVEGRPPFESEDALATMMAVMTSEHRPFELAGPLEPVLDGLLVKDPDERLDAPSARRLLQTVADRPVTEHTQVLTRPVTSAGVAEAGVAAGAGGAAALAGQPASRTTALEVADLRHQAAAAAPSGPPRSAPRPSPRPAVRPPARPPARPAERPGWLLPLAGAAALLIAVGGGVALSTGAMDDVLGAGDSAGTPAEEPAAQEPAPVDEAPAEGETSEQSEEQAREQAEAEQKAAEEQAKADEEAAKEAAEQEAAEKEAAEQEPTGQEATESGGGGGGAAAGLPAGWTTDTGGAGWTVALPPDYARTGNGVYRTPSRRTLRIETGPGQPDAVADREKQARSFASRHPSYREIRIEPVDYRGYEAADWEFTFEGVHVLNRVFVVDGVGHSLWLQAPEGDFSAAVQDFDTIAAAFQPVAG